MVASSKLIEANETGFSVAHPRYAVYSRFEGTKNTFDREFYLGIGGGACRRALILFRLSSNRL